MINTLRIQHLTSLFIYPIPLHLKTRNSGWTSATILRSTLTLGCNTLSPSFWSCSSASHYKKPRVDFCYYSETNFHPSVVPHLPTLSGFNILLPFVWSCSLCNLLQAPWASCMLRPTYNSLWAPWHHPETNKTRGTRNAEGDIFFFLVTI